MFGASLACCKDWTVSGDSYQRVGADLPSNQRLYDRGLATPQWQKGGFEPFATSFEISDK